MHVGPQLPAAALGRVWCGWLPLAQTREPCPVCTLAFPGLGTCILQRRSLLPLVLSPRCSGGSGLPRPGPQEGSRVLCFIAVSHHSTSLGQASINLGHTQSITNWCAVVARTCKLKENSRASLDVWTWAAPRCPAGAAVLGLSHRFPPECQQPASPPGGAAGVPYVSSCCAPCQLCGM